MNYEEIEQKHKKIIEVAKSYMRNIKDNEHGINHMYDVVNYTKELLSVIDDTINKEVCIIAAYWHDVGRVKMNIGHEELSSKMLKAEMEKYCYDNDFINACCETIENHKWNMTPKTKEGLLVKDADKLGWIGYGRWKDCLKNKQSLEAIISLIDKLRNEILYFDESKKIYDRDIVNLVKILYEEIYNIK